MAAPHTRRGAPPTGAAAMPRVSSTARSLHREHTSTPALLRLSASAAAMNAVIPLALAVQIALLGRLHRSRGEGATTQAAFGLCVTSCGVGVTVFNFLVDGVTAKVGERVGARRWRAAAGRVRMAIAAALACGCVATGALLALRETLFALFAIEGSDVAVRARTYYAYRALGIAPQCVASSLGGCLGGYRRVHAATALSTTRAMVETIAVAATLTLSADADVVMRRIGIAYVLVVVAHALVGGALVLGLTPEGAPGPLAILPAKWARARRRGSDDAAGDDGDDGDGDALLAPARAGDDDETDAEEGWMDFACDGASMLIRSILLQGSFFGAMVVASRELNEKGLAAHHVVSQLWMLSAYVVDGFATAGTVVGSRLVGMAVAGEGRRGGGDADDDADDDVSIEEVDLAGSDSDDSAPD